MITMTTDCLLQPLWTQHVGSQEYLNTQQCCMKCPPEDATAKLFTIWNNLCKRECYAKCPLGATSENAFNIWDKKSLEVTQCRALNPFGKITVWINHDTLLAHRASPRLSYMAHCARDVFNVPQPALCAWEWVHASSPRRKRLLLVNTRRLHLLSWMNG
jgi:hypothetical protein